MRYAILLTLAAGLALVAYAAGRAAERALDELEQWEWAQ